MRVEDSHRLWQNSLTEQNIHIIDDSATPVVLPHGTSITAENKWKLIESLSAALSRREGLSANLASVICDELLAREKLMSTGIGEQMAIPHAVIPDANRFMTECAIIKPGLDFESIDGSKAYIVVLLVAPKTALQQHLQMMASIARVFYQAETRQKFIAAKNAAEALALLK